MLCPYPNTATHLVLTVSQRKPFSEFAVCRTTAHDFRYFGAVYVYRHLFNYFVIPIRNKSEDFYFSWCFVIVIPHQHPFRRVEYHRLVAGKFIQFDSFVFHFCFPFCFWLSVRVKKKWMGGMSSGQNSLIVSVLSVAGTGFRPSTGLLCTAAARRHSRHQRLGLPPTLSAIRRRAQPSTGQAVQSYSIPSMPAPESLPSS